MQKKLELEGKRFGHQVVLERAGKDRRGSSLWKVKCDCGNIRVVRGSKLTSGVPSQCRSCASIIHGYSGSHYLYVLWNNLKIRCSNEKIRDYKYYGGRGITVYKKWCDFIIFKDYVLENIGERPTRNHSIDRINNDGNYEPGNLRWATKKTQSLNRRRKWKKT